jgi:hypothetical protein
MVSSFYSSNEAKERKYVKENRIRELNQEAQQDIVDEQIDNELGLESKATKMSALSKRITDKLVGTKPEVLKGDALLVRAINNGAITELFNKIKVMKDSTLTKTQIAIKNNLNLQSTKDVINELIQDALPNGVDAIKNVLINSLGGEGNQDSVLELITKADKINLKDFKPAYLPESKKAQNRENELMRSEDVNVIPKPLPSKPATTAQREAQAKAQANLDLISLFQQDVKEARKKESLKALDELNEMEDLRLRKNYMKVLDELKSEISSMSKQEQAKKQYKEDKMILDKMMNLIENQRMHDSFMEFSNLAVRDALATKIQKNLKSALNYKKSMDEVNKYLKKERIGVAREKVLKSQVGKTMNDLLNAVERDNTKSRSYSEATTEQGSLAGQKTDGRSLNKGRPPVDKLAAKNLAEFQQLESMTTLTTAEKKKRDNLKAKLFKRPMGAEDAPRFTELNKDFQRRMSKMK